MWGVVFTACVVFLFLIDTNCPDNCIGLKQQHTRCLVCHLDRNKISELRHHEKRLLSSATKRYTQQKPAPHAYHLGRPRERGQSWNAKTPTTRLTMHNPPTSGPFLSAGKGVLGYSVSKWLLFLHQCGEWFSLPA